MSENTVMAIAFSAGLLAAAFLFGLLVWFVVKWAKLPMMIEEKLNAIGQVAERIERNTRDKEPAEPV